MIFTYLKNIIFEQVIEKFFKSLFSSFLYNKNDINNLLVGDKLKSINEKQLGTLINYIEYVDITILGINNSRIEFEYRTKILYFYYESNADNYFSLYYDDWSNDAKITLVKNHIIIKLHSFDDDSVDIEDIIEIIK